MPIRRSIRRVTCRDTPRTIGAINPAASSWRTSATPISTPPTRRGQRVCDGRGASHNIDDDTRRSRRRRDDSDVETLIRARSVVRSTRVRSDFGDVPPQKRHECREKYRRLSGWPKGCPNRERSRFGTSPQKKMSGKFGDLGTPPDTTRAFFPTCGIWFGHDFFYFLE